MNILLTARPNFFKAGMGGILSCVAFSIFSIWLMSTSIPILGFIYLIASLLVLFCMYLYYSNMLIIIDTEKTMFKTGILSKHSTEVQHSDIKRMEVSQGIFDRIFDIGQISIYSSGDRPEIIVRGVDEYMQIKEILNIERQKKENSTTETIHKDDDITTQIEKISDLKDKGILTKEEFEAK